MIAAVPRSRINAEVVSQKPCRCCLSIPGKPETSCEPEGFATLLILGSRSTKVPLPFCRLSANMASMPTAALLTAVYPRARAVRQNEHSLLAVRGFDLLDKAYWENAF